EIELIFKKIENPAKELSEKIKQINLVVTEMIQLGYKNENALEQTLIGVMKGTVDFGRIGQNAGSIAATLANMRLAKTTAETVSRSLQHIGKFNFVGDSLPLLTTLATGGEVTVS